MLIFAFLALELIEIGIETNFERSSQDGRPRGSCVDQGQ